MAITSEVGISTWKSFFISFLISGIEYILIEYMVARIE